MVWVLTHILAVLRVCVPSTSHHLLPLFAIQQTHHELLSISKSRGCFIYSSFLLIQFSDRELITGSVVVDVLAGISWHWLIVDLERSENRGRGFSKKKYIICDRYRRRGSAFLKRESFLLSKSETMPESLCGVVMYLMIESYRVPATETKQIHLVHS